MKNSTCRSALVRALFFLAAFPVSISWATDYTWTNTANNTSGLWTNGVLWGNAASGYPGNAADTPSAYLTNNAGVAGGSYTNLLNAALGQTISNLVISNGNNGQAWLIVTNGATASTILTNSTFVLGSGGRLQIDSGGVVTGVTAFTWSGTNGTIVLNNSGQLFSTVAISLTAGRTGLVTTASSPGGTWNLGAQSLTVNSGSALTINGVTLTNIASAINVGTVAGTGSSLTLSNGAKVFSPVELQVGVVVGANNNTVNIGGLGAASLSSNRAFSIGANVVGGGGGNFNTLTVSNATFWSGYPGVFNEYLGASSTSNTVNVLAGGTWNVTPVNLVVGSGTATGNVLNINGGTVTNSGGLLIGNYGGGNVANGVTIANGGTYFSATAVTIGYSAGDSNNYFNVGGVGAASTAASGQIVVGNGGGGNNSLTLTNATLSSGNFFLGANSSNNTANVQAGGTWNLGNGAFAVGYGNATGNVATVNNAILTNINIVYVGGYTGGGSVGNSMTVSNGAKVFSAGTTVGGVADNNTLNIGGLGAASTWTNSGGFGVGSSAGNAYAGGSFNTLTISNATFWSGHPFFHDAIGSSATNNTVNVLAGATWTHQSGNNLYVGVGTSSAVSTGNVLNINGGILTNISTLLIGAGTGGGGIGNGVKISNGGQYISPGRDITVGYEAGDSNNYFNVGGVGASSLASNRIITVGNPGAGNNLLTVTNALLVNSLYVIVGSSSSNNTARVQAGGTWNMLGNTLYVGFGAAAQSNSVLVQGGTLKSTTLNNDTTASLLDIIGGGGTVTNVTYNQGATSTLRYEFTSAATVSAGIGVLNVGGTATRAGTLAVGLHGGIGSFLTTNTATLLTSGANSGSFTVTNRGVFALSGTATEIDALLDLTQKRLPTPLTLGAPQTLSSPGFNTGWFEVSTNYLAGFPTYGIELTITNAGATASVDALAAYLATSGETVTYTTNAANVYDFRLNPFATSTVASNAYFAWDFSPLDSNFLVTGAALFVPEPSTLLLCFGGAATIVWLRRRAKR